jgi:hypothetical protein
MEAALLATYQRLRGFRSPNRTASGRSAAEAMTGMVAMKDASWIGYIGSLAAKEADPLEIRPP